MSSNWQSVSDVAVEFGIDQNKDDIIHVLDILKENRAKIHPDKNGGDFSSSKGKETYHQLNDAVNYLEKTIETSNQLIPLSQLPAIIDSITSNLVRHTNASTNEMHRNLKHELGAELGRKTLSAKVSIVLVILVSLILFLQSGNLNNHLLLSKYGNSTPFLIIISTVLMSAILFFFYIINKERKVSQLMSYFMGDDALQYIFYKIKHVKNNQDSVSLTEIKRGLDDGEGKQFGFSGTKMKNAFDALDDDVINRIINLQLSKLIARKVLLELDDPNADRMFKVTD